MIGREDLALCWGSLHEANLQSLAEQAANAGFTGITLNSALFEDALVAGLSAQDITSRLADLGLTVSNIDPLFSWMPGAPGIPGEDVIARSSRASIDEVFDLACLLSCDLVNAPLGLAQPDNEQQIVDAFGALCDRAAARGLRVSLEFMPFNAVESVQTASRIVSAAGRSNGGIMFDCWHHHRGGGSPDDVLAVPPAQFFALQLDDAHPEPMADVVEETLNHRCLPGEGCIDLVAVLANLARIGAQPKIDVEVFHSGLRSLPTAEQARQLFTTSRSVLDRINKEN